MTLTTWKWITRLLSLWVPLRVWWRGRRESGYRIAPRERLGFYTHPASTGWVWVHAVSLGETQAARLWVDALREQDPHMRLLLTNGTATGREAGKALLREGDVQVWAPWDSPEATQQFFAHFQPQVGYLLETEVWPQLALAARAANCPLWLINARLSEKSLHKALRLGALARTAFGALTGVVAQTQEDAQRIAQLGGRVVGCSGNLKFDANPHPQQSAQGKAMRAGQHRPVIMLSSTREGEERMWLDAVQACTQQVQWLLVPRHPQRVDEVAHLCQQAGWQVIRRSALQLSEVWPLPPGDQPTLWLGDSMGEMPMYYGMADVAILGGSYAPMGGQNLIEAVAHGCPVIAGPHTFNFAAATQALCQVHAAVQVENMLQAVQTACLWVQQPQALQTRRQAGLQVIEQSRGAVERTLELVNSATKQ